MLPGTSGMAIAAARALGQIGTRDAAVALEKAGRRDEARKELDRLLKDYYRLRGWSETGLPEEN